MVRRRSTRTLIVLAALIALALAVYWVARFPPDTTPEGAAPRNRTPARPCACGSRIEA